MLVCLTELKHCRGVHSDGQLLVFSRGAEEDRSKRGKSVWGSGAGVSRPLDILKSRDENPV